jgi:hypothetical protein
MLTDIWLFLQDESNRDVLGWIGGGVVVVAGAGWAVLKFMVSSRAPKSPTVAASDGGVAAGRDISGSKIDTHGGTKR